MSTMDSSSQVSEKIEEVVGEMVRITGRKKALMGKFLSPNLPLSYGDGKYSDFIYTAVRGVGKTVIGMEVAIILKEKYGYENVKCYYFRHNENSIKALVTPTHAVDSYLVHKYDMNVTTCKNCVYNNGKLLYEAYPLVQAASVGKGIDLYDDTWFNMDAMTDENGVLHKRFTVTIWDEFMQDSDVGRKSIGDPVKQYTIFREAVYRHAERLPYNAVYNFLLANNVAECASVIGRMYGFIPNPNDRRIIKLTRKHALFWNVPVTKEYIEQKKRGYNGNIISENDANYRAIERDLSLIKPKKTRVYRLTQVIKFSKSPDDWFCVYDSKYIRCYNGEKFKKDKVIAMYRNQDEMFLQDRVSWVLDNSDYRYFNFCDLISMASFQAAMKLFKAK